MAGNEYKAIEHVESHVYFRPYWETNRDLSGFDANGYRDGHAVNLQIYEDGNPSTASVKLSTVPRDGDYVMRNRAQAKRLQLKISTLTSGWRMVGVQQHLMTIDKVAGPDVDYPSEVQWQAEFSSPKFWVSRDSFSPTLNRAAGKICGGAYDALTAGPDENASSALTFGVADGLSYSVLYSGGSHTFSTWVYGVISDPATLWKCNTGYGGTLEIKIEDVGGVYYVSWDDGVNGDSRALSWNGAGWVHIAAVRDGATIKIYENGAMLSSTNMIDTAITYGGTVQWMPTSSITAFDGRWVGRAVSGNALSYYYDDVINNAGNGGLLPINR